MEKQTVCEQRGGTWEKLLANLQSHDWVALMSSSEVSTDRITRSLRFHNHNDAVDLSTLCIYGSFKVAALPADESRSICYLSLYHNIPTNALMAAYTLSKERFS